jgi:hypothetical protein
LLQTWPREENNCFQSFLILKIYQFHSREMSDLPFLSPWELVEQIATVQALSVGLEPRVLVSFYKKRWLLAFEERLQAKKNSLRTVNTSLK